MAKVAKTEKRFGALVSLSMSHIHSLKYFVLLLLTDGAFMPCECAFKDDLYRRCVGCQ